MSVISCLLENHIVPKIIYLIPPYLCCSALESLDMINVYTYYIMNEFLVAFFKKCLTNYLERRLPYINLKADNLVTMDSQIDEITTIRTKLLRAQEQLRHEREIVVPLIKGFDTDVPKRVPVPIIYPAKTSNSFNSDLIKKETSDTEELLDASFYPVKKEISEIEEGGGISL